MSGPTHDGPLGGSAADAVGAEDRATAGSTVSGPVVVSTTPLTVASIVAAVAVLAAVVLSIALSQGDDELTIEAARATLERAAPASSGGEAMQGDTTSEATGRPDLEAPAPAGPTPTPAASASTSTAEPRPSPEPSPSPEPAAAAVAQPALTPDDMAADFRSLMQREGFREMSSNGNLWFDDCGGPDDSGLTTLVFDRDAELASITLFPTVAEAQSFLGEIVDVGSPCADFPDFFIDSVQLIDAANVRIRFGYEGQETFLEEHYVQRENAVVGIFDADGEVSADAVAMVADWVPGTLPPVPAPTPTPTQIPLPTPLPTLAPETFEPVTVPAGRSSVLLGRVVSFEISSPRPAQIFAGHTAIYLDDTYAGEVDLFVPYATADGAQLFGFEDVLDHVETDPKFSNLLQFNDFDLGGRRVVGFIGSGPELDVGFYTAPDTVGVENAGWRFPGRLELWVVQAPGVPIIVTGETLDADVARTDEVQTLLTEVLGSLEFGAP